MFWAGLVYNIIQVVRCMPKTSEVDQSSELIGYFGLVVYDT